jgi:hypothetical protein
VGGVGWATAGVGGPAGSAGGAASTGAEPRAGRPRASGADEPDTDDVVRAAGRLAEGEAGAAHDDGLADDGADELARAGRSGWTPPPGADDVAGAAGGVAADGVGTAQGDGLADDGAAAGAADGAGAVHGAGLADDGAAAGAGGGGAGGAVRRRRTRSLRIWQRSNRSWSTRQRLAPSGPVKVAPQPSQRGPPSGAAQMGQVAVDGGGKDRVRGTGPPSAVGDGEGIRCAPYRRLGGPRLRRGRARAPARGGSARPDPHGWRRCGRARWPRPRPSGRPCDGRPGRPGRSA